MTENVLLVDYENIGKLDLAAVPAGVRVPFFFGASQRSVPTDFLKAALKLGERFVPIDIEGQGKNALDFHIAFYLGECLTHAPHVSCVILSRDKGFDPLIRHLVRRGFAVRRANTLAEALGGAALPGSKGGRHAGRTSGGRSGAGRSRGDRGSSARSLTDPVNMARSLADPTNMARSSADAANMAWVPDDAANAARSSPEAASMAWATAAPGDITPAPADPGNVAPWPADPGSAARSGAGGYLSGRGTMVRSPEILLEDSLSWLAGGQRNRRPRKRKGLIAHLYSHFSKKISEAELHQLVDRMIAAGKLSEANGSITYHF